MSVRVVSVAGMRDWERRIWEAGVREADVIARVGECISLRIRSLTRKGDRILLLCGRGNNGADAQAAVPHLSDRVVDAVLLRDPVVDRGALDAALGKRPALVVDALFGIGLNRPLDPSWCACLSAVNSARLRVLAVDVPSGLNADTGESWGEIIDAAWTLTVGAAKQGMLVASSWEHVGRLEVAREVGLTGEPGGTDDRHWVLDPDFEAFPPRRNVTLNKGSLGKAVVLAGSIGYSGAAVLSCRAAGRARPGLLSALVPQEVHLPVSMALPSAMVHPFVPQHPVLERATAILAGPGLARSGLSPEIRTEVLRLWREFPGILVVDASSLAWLVEEPPDRASGVRVITPHSGEAARLLGRTVSEVQRDRVGALRELARRYRAWVVLKGHQTLIGTETGTIHVNSTGNPGLAQGGTGDVLAGFLTGLIAQPMIEEDLETALAYAVWEHGRAADRLESRCMNWTAEGLADEIGSEVRR